MLKIWYVNEDVLFEYDGNFKFVTGNANGLYNGIDLYAERLKQFFKELTETYGPLNDTDYAGLPGEESPIDELTDL